MDGGVRDGVDIARALACGARLTFMGRPWMYGVGALGTVGGHQVAEMMQRQLVQVMIQVGARTTADLPHHLLPTA